MAGTPPSTLQTHRPFLDFNLKSALLEFASRYMKEKLERLAHECDRRLERELLPKLLLILHEIDRERDVFEELQREAARHLRDQLSLLRCTASAVDDAVGQLHAVRPRYFGLLPNASTLAFPASDSPCLSAPGTSVPSASSFVAPDSDIHKQASVSAATTTESLSSHRPRDTTTQAKKHLSVAKLPGSEDHALGPPISTPEPSSSPRRQDLTTRLKGRLSTALTQTLDSQLLDEDETERSMTPHNSKRPNINCHDKSENDKGDAPSKRQKVATEENPSDTADSKTTRRVAFPNLMTGECIFRHAEQKGFFVIRCSYCEPGIFTKPPLVNNRALTHFQEHSEAVSGDKELTNELIFERFACRVDGGEMASKYWIREHLGATPHTFIPVKFAQQSSDADDTEDITHEDPEANDTFSPPFTTLRDSLRGRQSDIETEPERPRRTLRNVPRPDYAEMVANKDPWNVPDVETEKGFAPISVLRPSPATRRRSTKPGTSSKADTADLKKPFGYMSEPWPRRSAPR
ncbi:hypothetical protein GGS21DRAFT_513303 [Xylaria nigripes]|nr:hypothetical protein GGS21DRAFT_513303 [Xylaria nigripes]